MTEQEKSWYQEAELLGLPILQAIGLHANAIMEAFGPQKNQAPISIYEESLEPTQDELLEIAMWAKKFINKDKAPHVLNKTRENEWTYRRLSWSQGPTWFPIPGPLYEILNRI